MKRFITTALMLTCLVVCTFAQSIVGTWKATPETIKKSAEFDENEEGQTDLLFTFNADNSFKTLVDYHVDVTGTEFSMKIAIKINIPGDYKVQNNTLITKIKKKRLHPPSILVSLVWTRKHQSC